MTRIVWGICGCFAIYMGWVLSALILLARPEDSNGVMAYVWSIVAGALWAAGIYALGDATFPDSESTPSLIIRKLARETAIIIPICLVTTSFLWRGG